MLTLAASSPHSEPALKVSSCPSNIYSFFANSFSLVNGVAPNVAIYSVGLVNAGSFFGRGMSGFLADKLGVWRLFIGGGIGSAITLFALWTKPDIGTVGTIFGLVIFGATSGAFITLVAATCASISPVKEFGGRLGLTWSMSAFPILCGPQVSAGELPSLPVSFSS